MKSQCIRFSPINLVPFFSVFHAITESNSVNLFYACALLNRNIVLSCKQFVVFYKTSIINAK